MIQYSRYLKAIDLDAKIGFAYHNLAITLEPSESVTLLDNTTMSKEDLFEKAKELQKTTQS